jgi:hypothetical protein
MLSTQAELVKRHMEGAASADDAERLLILLNKFTSRSVDAWAKYAELSSDDSGVTTATVLESLSNDNGG